MTRKNRREFAIDVASASFAMIASSSTPSLAGPPPHSGDSANKWRVGVVGHTGRGDYGHGLDVMWSKIPEAEVVAVADGAGNVAANKRMPQVQGFSDYGSMLREIRPHIVAIAPRHVDQHHAMCLAAMDADVRGIYIEKPFCRTPLEADQIVAACERRKVSLAVAHRNRYHPVLGKLRELIAAGEIGELLEIRARGKEDTRGGALDLWVLGSHLMNLADYFAGPAVACSGMLYQDGRPCTRDDLREGAEGTGPIAGNQVHARFEMAGGLPLFFDSIVNRGDHVAGFGIQLIGTKGVFDLRVDQNPLAHFRKGNLHHPVQASQPWLAVSTAGIDQPEPIANLHADISSHLVAGRDLIESIEQGRRPLCDAKDGRTTVEMICAVFESHLQGGARVAIPLKERQHPFS